MAEGEKAAPDWERIEAEFRAGILSLREIAALHPGTNHVAIARRAKREEWPRDLQPKIKARADELVTRAAVTPDVTAKRKATDKEVIEANAVRIADIQGGQKATAARIHSFGLTLLAELESQTINLEDLESLGELLRAEDKNGQDRLNDLYRKIIETPSRVDSAKKVAETLKHAIGLERQAYGLDKQRDDDPPGEITITF